MERCELVLKNAGSLEGKFAWMGWVGLLYRLPVGGEGADFPWVWCSWAAPHT